MATFKAPDLNSKPLHMGGYGNAVIIQGSVSPTAGASGDVYYPVRIPAGMLITDLDIINDDLDTGGTAMSASIGYEPVNAADGPTAAPTFFSATGTFLTAAGRKTCTFQPLKFEKDVFITLTLTVAATTFATGAVTAVAKGIGEGIH
jgi:hypothetical protein